MPFKIGEIVNTHGIGGEVRVYPTTDDPSRFKLLDKITLKNALSETEARIERVRFHKQIVILKLKGVDDRTAAGKLKNFSIYIPDELALPLGENEYYARDLYGMSVVLEGGQRLGELSDILFTGANDVYVIKPLNGKEILIPAIENCVLDVDIGRRTMTVRLLEGLL